jgi:hypothetical protein
VRSADRTIILLVALLPFILLGHALLPGRVLAPVDVLMTAYPWRALAPGVTPANPLLTDVTYLVHPLLLWGAREIGEGRLPLWNPQLLAGAPYLANPHTAMFFPLTWLLWVLPAATALTLLAIGKICLVGVATYWCGRRLALSRGPAALAAVAFMLSGQVVAWLHWPYATTMAFLPILVGLVERMRVRRDSRALAMLVVAVALALFAGYPQGAAWALLVSAVWALAVAGTAVGGAPRFLMRFAAGVVLGAAVAAVQIVPFAEYARESAVVAYREQWFPYLALPARAAVTWLVPFFFGGPQDYRGDWNLNVVTLTVGVAPLLTVPVALVVAWRTPATRILSALAAVSAAMVYGVPWVGPALASLPVLSWGQSLRVAPVLSFAVAMLGAIGMEAIMSADVQGRRRAALAVVATAAGLAGAIFAAVAFQPQVVIAARGGWGSLPHVLVFLAALTITALTVLRWLRHPQEQWRAVVVLLTVELVTLGPLAARINIARDAAWLYPEPPVMAALRGLTSTDHGRILVGRHNIAMLHGLSEPTGHDGMTPRRLEEIAGPLGTGRTIGTIGSEPLGAGAVFASGALDALGVRWLVVPPGVGAPRADAPLKYDGPDARVYENPRAMPRVLRVPVARCLAASDSRTLIRGGIDWKAEVLLSGDCQDAPLGSRDGGVGSAQIRHDKTDRVLVDVDGERAAYLVLFDTWFPGWRVRIDGADARLFRADHAFRAVWVPAGRHVVEFRYRPASVIYGALVSALALIVVAVLAVGPRWRRLGVAAAMLILTAGAGDAAALEPIPLKLTAPAYADQSTVVTLSVRLHGAANPSAPAADVYLVWAFRPDARFLTSDGAWTPEPVAIRAGVRIAELAPLEIRWRAEPPGAISFALLAVKPGGDPIDRATWLWQPDLAWVTVRAPRALDRVERQMLWGVGVAAVFSVAIVAFDLRRR